MMYRATEDLFPVLEELNIGLVASSPLANACLTDSYKKVTIFNAYSANMDITEGEVSKIDNLLNQMKMSEIFGGSRVKR